MANDVLVGTGKVTGQFFHAEITPDLEFPAYPSETLTADWKEVGWISEDGITQTPFGSITDIRDWSRKIRRRVMTQDGKVAATILSTSEESMKTVFGPDKVTTTAATAQHGKLVSVNLESGPSTVHEAYLFIGVDGDDEFMLLCKDGVISNVTDISYAPGDAIKWGVEIEGTWIPTFDDGVKGT